MAVRSAILATAWLLVIYTRNSLMNADMNMDIGQTIKTGHGIYDIWRPSTHASAGTRDSGFDIQTSLEF